MLLETRVQRLEEFEAIRALVNRMRRGADRQNDPAMVREIFSEDVHWRTQGGADALGSDLSFEGREALVEGSSMIAQNIILQSFHHFGPVEINLDAETGYTSATALWYLFELAKRGGDNKVEVIVGGGWYDAKLRKTGDRWHIHDLTLHIKFGGPAPADWSYPD